MPISADFGKYLGVPISRGRKPTDSFQYIVDRVKTKLNTWSENSLSMAGRITLAKSVLSSIPIYPMQVAKIPFAICSEVERLQRNFIWGKSHQTHGFHPIGWDQLVMPKLGGGLGFKRLSSFNWACGAKLTWTLIKGDRGLWAEVLLHKYMLRDENDLLSTRPDDSPVWKFITQQKDIIQKGMRWHIRDGRSVSFFNDCWLYPDKCLRDVCGRELTHEEQHSKVVEWTKYGSWDTQRIGLLVPSEVCQRITTMLPPIVDAGSDVMAWNATNDGNFSVKSAYFLIENHSAISAATVYRKIWKWEGVERIRVFLWLAFNNRLPTNAWRSKWASTSSMCRCCMYGIEDVLHILRDCRFASDVWRRLVHPNHQYALFSSSLRDWFAINLNTNLSYSDSDNWRLIWGVAIWMFWKWRNLAEFDDGYVKPNDPYLVILHSWKRYVCIPKIQAGQTNNADLTVSWQPPPTGWVKLNVDGSVLGDFNQAGCGGVLRDSEGNWIAGFTQILGPCTVFEAEQWAIFRGLQFSWDLGFRKIILESDAKNLVRCLLEDEKEVADALAKLGRSTSTVLDSCPHSIRVLMQDECLGLFPN